MNLTSQRKHSKVSYDKVVVSQFNLGNELENLPPFWIDVSVKESTRIGKFSITTKKKSNFVDSSPGEDEGHFCLYLSDCEIEKDLPTSNSSEQICLEIPETFEATKKDAGKFSSHPKFSFQVFLN